MVTNFSATAPVSFLVAGSLLLLQLSNAAAFSVATTNNFGLRVATNGQRRGQRRRLVHYAEANPSSQDQASIGQLEGLLNLYQEQQEQVVDNVDEIQGDELPLNPEQESAVKSALTHLASSASDEDNRPDEDLFDPLIGNYKVLYTLPSKPNERPVGGKWSRRGKASKTDETEDKPRRPRKRLIQLTGSWQHLAPSTVPGSVAQAINLITLNVWGGAFLRISVLLHGNAYKMSRQQREEIATERQTPGGLSARTVQVDFEPPRIVLHRPFDDDEDNAASRVLLCFSLGPLSSVILDTPFANNKIRLGKGSRGSLFVFGRDNRPSVQEEWTRLLALQPMAKWKLLLASTLVSSLVTWGWIRACWIGSSRILPKLLGAPLVLVSLLSTAILSMGSGGIERDRDMSARDAVKMRRTQEPESSVSEQLAP